MSLLGCGSSEPSVDGPLLVSGSGDGSGNDAMVAGKVAFEDGCLLLAGMPVVWPEGTTWDAEAQEVVLRNGDRVTMGDEVSGGGGYPYADTLTDVIGERGARLAAECAGPTNEVAFFNAGSEVVRAS
jgi:hypothetical protein